MISPERISRRRVLQFGAGLGLAATALAGEAFTPRVSVHYKAQENHPESNIPFRFDADREITKADWEGIFTAGEYTRNHPLPNTPELARLKYNISFIDEQQAKKIGLSDDDWQRDSKALEFLLKPDFTLYVPLTYAVAMRGVYDDKKAELYTLLEPHYDRMVEQFQLLKTTDWETYFLPEQAFAFQMLYPERESDFNIEETRPAVERLLKEYRKGNSGTEDNWDGISEILPHAKHIYPGITSEYSDEKATKGLQESFTSSLTMNRSAQNWWEFTRRAAFAELLEANSAQMTPQGLELS